MSQLLEEQQTKVQKQQHKASDVFLNATEKQCSGVFRFSDKDGEKYCAIGLLGLYADAYDGELFNVPSFGKIQKKFGEDLQHKEVKCPACNRIADIRGLLPHLNNSPIDGMVHPSHGWTFKQIGQWLQSIGH